MYQVFGCNWIELAIVVALSIAIRRDLRSRMDVIPVG